MLGAQLAHLAEQAPVLERPGHPQLELIEVEGLLHEIVGALPHRPHRGLDRAIGGHHQHAGPLIAVAGGAQDCDAVGARKGAGR